MRHSKGALSNSLTFIAQVSKKIDSQKKSPLDSKPLKMRECHSSTSFKMWHASALTTKDVTARWQAIGFISHQLAIPREGRC